MSPISSAAVVAVVAAASAAGLFFDAPDLSTLDPLALACATAAFVVARAAMSAFVRPVVSGPAAHMANGSDMPGTSWLEHALLGHAVNTLSARHHAGDLHVALVRNASTALSKASPSTPASKLRHPAVGFWFGPSTLQLLVTHPRDVRHVLVDHPELYPKSEQMDYLIPLFGRNGLVNIRNEQYHTRQARQVARAFAPQSVRGMAAVSIRRHFAGFVSRLRRRLEASEGRRARVEVQASMSDVTLAVIAESAFRATDDDEVTFDLIKRRIVFEVSILMAFLPPWIFNRLPMPRHRRDRSTRKDMFGIVSAARRSAAIHEHDATSTGSRLIDLLAEEKSITDEQLLDHAMTFVFAGHETTAVALTWMCYALSQDSAVQERLAAELADAFDAGAMPTVDALQELPFLTAVINETLRLYSPIISVLRENPDDDVLPGTGTFVPRGTTVMVPFYALHRDKGAYGDDADTFRPARWVDDPGLQARVTPYNFMPFGHGKRGCIGRQFASLELLVGAALIFRNFRVSWPDGQKHPHRQHGATARPRDPFDVTFELRGG